MRLSRSGAFVGGVVLTVVVGGGTAVASGGTSVLFGHGNVGKTTTGLTDTKGTPLSLVAKKGAPALKVSNTVKVKNLDSDLLDGRDSTSFLAASGKAADSALLGGQPAAAFLGAGATAADSSKLGGQLASSYLGSLYTTKTEDTSADPLINGGETKLDTVQVPAGTYAVAFTALLQNSLVTDTAHFACQLLFDEAAGTDDGQFSVVNVPASNAGAVVINQVITLPAATTVSVSCLDRSGTIAKSGFVASSTLMATRIQDLHGVAYTFGVTPIDMLRTAGGRH